jgi:hypothetical protein
VEDTCIPSGQRTLNAVRAVERAELVALDVYGISREGQPVTMALAVGGCHRVDGHVTFALSVTGVVLAVIANVWNIATFFVRVPRVSVETQYHLYVVPAGAPRKDKIDLTVINRGAEARSISSIGLRATDGSFTRDFQRDHADYPDQVPNSHNDPLPLRIEGHSALRWTYGPKQLAEFRSGTTVEGYAKYYKSFRWPWQKDDLTEKTETCPRTETIR